MHILFVFLEVLPYIRESWTATEVRIMVAGAFPTVGGAFRARGHCAPTFRHAKPTHLPSRQASDRHPRCESGNSCPLTGPGHPGRHAIGLTPGKATQASPHQGLTWV